MGTGQRVSGRPELQQLQLERLKTTLRKVGATVPFYRNEFSKLKLDFGKVKSLDDLRRFPFTTKQDLRNN